MTKKEAQLEQLSKAIDRFKEVLEQEKNDFIRDSAIQRFEIVIDLAWKTLKTTLEEVDNIIVQSPTKAFREAAGQGYIKNEGKWIEYIKMRNETTHMYKEELANKVYEKLPQVQKSLQELFKNLQKL